MADNDLAYQLNSRIHDLLTTYDTGTFGRHWAFYEITGYIPVVQAYYIKIDRENGYFNAAILGQGKLVDITNDCGNSAGGCSISSLDSVTGVILRAGSLPTFALTERARLVVLTDLLGGRANGPYWFAETDEEEERLLNFVKPLIQLVANTDSDRGRS